MIDGVHGVYQRDGRPSPLFSFDGRLDNRDELIAALGAGTDAELVERAYGKWGSDCPARLLGDFAFAVWDERQRLLFCARDPFGVRPFYYFLNSRVFRFASDVRALRAAPEVSADVNEGVVAEYLAFSHSTRDETLYSAIRRLPAGSALTIEAERMREWRWWEPPAGRVVRLRDEREYAERFREILTAAVACRGGDACLMSGGLDSSSVALLAKVPTFSLVFPQHDCDESAYIEAVVEAGHLASQRLAPVLPDAEALDRLVAEDGLPPVAPNYQMLRQMFQLAHSQGHRRMVTGQAGDHAMVGSRLYYADLLRRGRLLSLRKAVRSDFGDDRQRAWGELRTAAVYPLVAPALMGALRRWRRGADDDLPPWLTARFVQQTNLRDRLRRPAALVQALPQRVEREYYRVVAGAELAYSMETNYRCAAAHGMELAHPFLDRRLIEFAFHIPPELWLRGDETKRLLRQAMQGILPDLVRRRQDKAEFSMYVLDALRQLPLARWLEESRLAQLGWIEVDVLRAAYEDAPMRWLGPIWEACSMEWWLRRLG